MEDRLDEIERKQEVIKRNLKSYKLWRFIPLPVMIVLTSLTPLYTSILLGKLAMEPFTQADSVFAMTFGIVDIRTFMTIVVGAISLPLGSMFSLLLNSFYKNMVKNQRGLTNEKTMLEEAIPKEKEYLKEIQKSQKKEKMSEQFMVKKVDDKELLEGLKAHLMLYYDCGYNEDKYAKYYRNGTLHKKLRKYYTEKGIEKIENSLEENTSVKIKTRKR